MLQLKLESDPDLAIVTREITSRRGVDKRSLLPLVARRDAVAKAIGYPTLTAGSISLLTRPQMPNWKSNRAC
jgi:hypothetical protein